jgi:hypothetical protein
MYTPRNNAWPKEISRSFTPSLLRVRMSSTVFGARVRVDREKCRKPLLPLILVHWDLTDIWFRTRDDAKIDEREDARDVHFDADNAKKLVAAALDGAMMCKQSDQNQQYVGGDFVDGDVDDGSIWRFSKPVQAL